MPFLLRPELRQSSHAPASLVVRAARAVIDGHERPATLVVEAGRISAVLDAGSLSAARAPGDLGTVTFGDDVVLLPGLVDSHVHLQEPGRDGWEGFASGTRAAAAGGVTTVADMPLDSLPVTTSVAALEVKLAAALGQAMVDVGFWGGAVPGSLGDLRALLRAGCVGVKAYLSDSGLADFPPLDRDQLARAMDEVRPLEGVVAVHAEDPYAIATGAADTETAAVATVIATVRATGGRAHVVHVGSADAADLIASARAEGLRVTAETCPHYLVIDTGTGARPAMCSPPVGDRANRDRLWAHVVAGTLGSVVSDHSPSPGDVPGIASLELGLPLVWTEARTRGVPLATVVDRMAAGPAALLRLPQKGRIAVGSDADFCVFAPGDRFVVEPARLHQRQKRTPYAGLELTGVIRETWLRGVRIVPETSG